MTLYFLVPLLIHSSDIYAGAASSQTQNPLDTLPRSFPVDREVANLLRTC